MINDLYSVLFQNSMNISTCTLEYILLSVTHTELLILAEVDNDLGRFTAVAAAALQKMSSLSGARQDKMR